MVIVKTFSVEDRTAAKALKMAKEESRSFSNFISKLIEQEWERRQTAKAPAITMDEAAERG